jgi:hypothetical protein
MFDIALIPRATSLAHTEAAIVGLMQLLDIPNDGLRTGIARANELRRKLATVERDRSGDGPIHERLGRASLWSNAARWIDSLDLPQGRGDARRLLLAGSVPVDDRIHRAVAQAGADIAGEAHMFALQRFGPPIDAESDACVRAVALALRQASVAPRAFLDRAAWMVERARSVRAAAVLVWLVREDEALAWQLPVLRRALGDAGLPVLALPAANWQVDERTVESIDRFLQEDIDATA